MLITNDAAYACTALGVNVTWSVVDAPPASAARVPLGVTAKWAGSVECTLVTCSGAVPVFVNITDIGEEDVATRTAPNPRERLEGLTEIAATGLTGVKLEKPRVAIEARPEFAVPDVVAVVPATLKSLTSK